jgi:hypothetical protein
MTPSLGSTATADIIVLGCHADSQLHLPSARPDCMRFRPLQFLQIFLQPLPPAAYRVRCMPPVTALFNSHDCKWHTTGLRQSIASSAQDATFGGMAVLAGFSPSVLQDVGHEQ